MIANIIVYFNGNIHTNTSEGVTFTYEKPAYVSIPYTMSFADLHSGFCWCTEAETPKIVEKISYRYPISIFGGFMQYQAIPIKWWWWPSTNILNTSTASSTNSCHWVVRQFQISCCCPLPSSWRWGGRTWAEHSSRKRGRMGIKHQWKWWWGLWRRIWKRQWWCRWWCGWWCRWQALTLTLIKHSGG